MRQYVNADEGEVFALTPWAEYALYELGSALIGKDEESKSFVNAAIDEAKMTGTFDKWEMKALQAFARKYARDYDIFDGHLRRCSIDEEGRYYFDDAADLEDDDIDFLEDYPQCPYVRVYLPAVHVFAYEKE